MHGVQYRMPGSSIASIRAWTWVAKAGVGTTKPALAATFTHEAATAYVADRATRTRQASIEYRVREIPRARKINQ